MIKDLDNQKLDEQNEFDDEEIECIDIFCLRVLSLIVCRGKPTQKASFMADLANENH